MPIVQKREEKFTYADYLTWPAEERWELINGKVYNMTPAPSVKHQRIVGSFYAFLVTCLKGKPCIPFIAPTDVVLSEHDVVQPDVFVVCDPQKISRENIQGSPDMIVEVISPATVLKDRREKKTLYEKFGVKEYILIDPDGQYVERFILESNGRFSKGEIYSPQEEMTLHSLAGITIKIWDIFGIEKQNQNV